MDEWDRRTDGVSLKGTGFTEGFTEKFAPVAGNSAMQSTLRMVHN